MVRIRKRPNPADRLAGSLKIQHSRQSPPIVRPASTVGEEELRFLAAVAGAGGVVVAGADEAGAGGAVVVRGETGVFVGRAFGCFDDDEAEAAGVG